MTETDDAILEFFEALEPVEFRLELPPMVVWIHLTERLGTIEKSKNTIARRMKKLAAAGLLERSDDKRGYYRLTDKGVEYLNGNLSKEDLRLPDEDD